MDVVVGKGPGVSWAVDAVWRHSDGWAVTLRCRRDGETMEVRLADGEVSSVVVSALDWGGEERVTMQKRIDALVDEHVALLAKVADLESTLKSEGYNVDSIAKGGE